MSKQNSDNWDEYGCISENQVVAEEVARALVQDSTGKSETPPPNEPKTDQTYLTEQKMPVASAQD